MNSRIKTRCFAGRPEGPPAGYWLGPNGGRGAERAARAVAAVYRMCIFHINNIFNL